MDLNSAKWVWTNLSAQLLARTVVGWGVGGGGREWEELGLTDANDCSWNGLMMRSCWVALRTVSGYLLCSTTMGEKITYTCMCNRVPMLYSEGKKITIIN